MVTISLYNKKGMLRKYEARICEDNEAIKAFIKELCPDFYNSAKWAVEKVTGDNGWIRIGMATTGARILVNVFNA